jgi:hypothetical protein
MKSKTKMLITNINTLSALFDRLITERIKAFFFSKNNNLIQKKKQEKIIKQIKIEISNTLLSSIKKKKYHYLSEQRTFKHNSEKLVKQLEELTFADLNIGIADNKLSNSIKTSQNNNLLENIKLSRISLEKRAMLKNEIDKSYKKFFK